jgi:hypothetical protein
MYESRITMEDQTEFQLRTSLVSPLLQVSPLASWYLLAFTLFQ